MDNVIEPAKTGRASCRTCRKKIDKGELRFGEAIVNNFDPEGGMTHVWHHLVCAAGRMPEKVKPTLDAYTGEVPNRADIDKALESGGKKAAAKAPKKTFPYAERAPTGRSKCVECDEPIEKDTWRVAIEREIDTGSFMTSGAGYLHPKCVLAHTGDIWEDIAVNSDLNAEDLADLRGHAQG